MVCACWQEVRRYAHYTLLPVRWMGTGPARCLITEAGQAWGAMIEPAPRASMQYSAALER